MSTLITYIQKKEQWVRKYSSFKMNNPQQNKISKLILLFSCCISVVFCNSATNDAFRFASHYESHMVLQRAPQRSLIWGYGEISGTDVYVQVEEKKAYETKTYETIGGSIVWKVILDPISYGGPYQVNASSLVDGKMIHISLVDVLFGDVWFCGGQSNMVFTVSMAMNAEKEIDNASTYSDIRLFTVERYFSTVPVMELEQKNILQHWSVASAESVGGKAWRYFSAVCWMYARRLYDLYHVPIGLISSSYGGTCVEAWSSHDALQKCGLKRQAPNSYTDSNSHTVLWNAMIRPFINTTIYGVVWYQGERNALTNPLKYNCTFPALITDWRKKWFDGTNGNTEEIFPFGFVQLASLGKDGKRDYFPLIRWYQTAGYGYVPNSIQQNVFMAVAMDLADDKSPYGSIHPRDKTTVADRLILGARTIAYKEDVNFQGPIVDTCLLTQIEGQTMVKVVYRKVDSEGIVVKSRSGFQVLTGNSSDVWIPVRIYSPTSKSNGVLIEVPQHTKIIAVRYAWTQRPCDYKKCAIYSARDDLPAPPSICYLV